MGNIMVDCRMLNKNKNNVNQYYLNGLLVVLYTMALVFESHGSIMETWSDNGNCSDAMTCTTCAVKYRCRWSLKIQTCIRYAPFNTSSLMVFNKEDCPRISVVKIYSYDKIKISLQYIVKVSNDSVGFLNYLFKNNMYCKRQSLKMKYLVEKKHDEFICSMILPTFYHKLMNVRSVTEFITLKFNEVMLRFDDVLDHYVTFYEHDKCAFESLHNCVICAWNNNGFSNYLKWCNSNNTCEVRKEFYNLKNTGDAKLKYLGNPVYEEVYLTNKCPDINVTWVGPLSGPQAGGTSVSIEVRNHMLLADNRTVTVMVAGTVCTNPKSSGQDTITCTTSPWVGTNGASTGPILVKYSSPNAGLTIESSQKFMFDIDRTCGTPSPVLDQNQRISTVPLGGINVPVRGVHFIEPCVVSPARLFVLLNGTMQFASSYCDPPINNTYMICRSPSVNFTTVDGNAPVEERLLDFGINVMNFTRNQALFVDGPSLGFFVYLNPVLVDFEIDESGSVVVNGHHLQHFRLDDILIRILDPSDTNCVIVSITQKNIICEPTTPIAATVLPKILVKIGDSLSYTVPHKLPLTDDESSELSKHDHPSTLFSWFHVIIALTMSLLFVCALAYYLKTNNWDSLSEIIRHPLVDSTES
ncbi:uncharacterized protein LOC132938752 isoform X2 [Metopolophium dirhodum]|uniref:uncharacterized protein LOC132938752 isoform X2 n=1 Tax=Metopolophium dirhodum TaxID=44670 RepID=UPI00298FE93F|nr:uncharacterized protein LOC132938752 isoform X2 [Metopolophium dirhodum]